MMNLINLLKERRSIRKFTDKKVDKSSLEKMVEVARYAPTANNVQPWDFIVVTDKNKLNKITNLIDQGKDFPACIVVFTDKVKHALEDGANASTYLLLAAKALGLGTCWIAGYNKPFANELKSTLAVPEDKILISIISIGHPNENPKPEKKELETTIHWENY